MTIRTNCLIIGSTGRNTGKTEFACRIIKNHSAQKEIIGIKVIPVDKNEESCHRGTDGCGLCDSLTGDYQIIEETNTDLPKDTARMLNAGAKKVYLLLVDRRNLEKGMTAVWSKIPDNALVIIESNSIRKVVTPGLFIVIRKSGNHAVKQSCAEVMEFADKLVEVKDREWDFSPDKVFIRNESWVIP